MRKMWFSKGFAELILGHIDDLERRVKRLEQIEAKNILNATEVKKDRLVSLKNTEVGKNDHKYNSETIYPDVCSDLDSFIDEFLNC